MPSVPPTADDPCTDDQVWGNATGRDAAGVDGGAPFMFGLANPRILRGETDVVGNFDFDRLVLQPFKVGTSNCNYAFFPWFLPGLFENENVFLSFQGANYEFKDKLRTRLDPTPPASVAKRIAPAMLPNCANFKVEWTLDPRGEFVNGRLEGVRDVFWFDPGAENPLAELVAAIQRAPDDDTRRRLERLLNARTFHPDNLQAYSLTDRFRGDPDLWEPLAPDGRSNLIVFNAHRLDRGATLGCTDDKIVPEDIFPRALRITIDVYDQEGRLERPIRHVIVAPVGG